MDDLTLLRTADRNLRRKFAGNIPGLTAFADNLASEAQGNPVTITTAASEGGSTAGSITMPREIWLTAAEALLVDGGFNGSAAPRRSRMIMPDYSFATPV